jgi:hypothetical protein
MSNLITIYQTNNPFEADLIKSYFSNENVFCFLKTNDASGVLPYIGFTQGGTEILVRQEDLEKGKELLQQIKDNLNSTDEAGEANS